MSIQGGFHAEDKTIEDILFGQKKYRIPRYQRPYSWSADEVVDFWNDIKQPEASCFIGSFVFNLENLKKENLIEIIDGQQRILTITIFMAAIRDILREMGEMDNAKRIQTNCIAFEDRRGRQTYRVECGESLNEFFEKHIQSYSPDPFPERPNKEELLVIRNYEFFKNEIINEIEQYSGKSKKSTTFMHYGIAYQS